MDQREIGAKVLAPFRALTPGQRWTASLAVGLGVAILAWGLPTPGGPLLGAPAAAGPAPPTGSAAPVAMTAAPTGTPVRPDGVRAPAGTGAAAGPEQTVTAAPPGVTGPTSTVVRVAALVAEPSLAETRADAAIVGRLAAGAALQLDVVAATAADACERAGRADVAIAATDLPTELRGCLADRGAVVVAHDARGAEPVTGGAPATVVSTRRGVGPSLLENAERALEDGTAVGIVADESLRDAVEATLPALRGRGIDVVATAYVGPLDRVPLDHVLAFVGAGVETVVHATSVDNQVVFASGLAVVRPGVRHVVADVADTVVNETYPPAFDGALAVSPVATPWGDRVGGADQDRTACLERWERSQAPPQVLDAEERVRVLAWCQLLDIAEGVAPGGAASLLQETVASTLTSPLGPLPAPATWGPVASALLRWSVACRCWEPVEGFG